MLFVGDRKLATGGGRWEVVGEGRKRAGKKESFCGGGALGGRTETKREKACSLKFMADSRFFTCGVGREYET